MYVAVSVAIAYAAFVTYRLRAKESVPTPETEPYQPISAQAPLTSELGPQPVEQESTEAAAERSGSS